MIIVKLIGGLGNQMFQYATARQLALLHKTDLKLDIVDLRREQGCTKRHYALGAFNILENFANNQEISRLKNNYWLEKLFGYQKKSHIKEKVAGQFDADLFKIKPSFYLDGYWQSEQYFTACADVIRRDFQLKPALLPTDSDLLAAINHSDSVAVHIRRGDYVNNEAVAGIYNCCNLDYYRRAVELMAAKLAQPHFFIFSDDPTWVRDNFKIKYPLALVSDSGYQDFQELDLLSRCRHQIIANSSFSWWGAWLNTNPQKIVIAPGRWFNSDNLSSQDIIPDTWLTINI